MAFVPDDFQVPREFVTERFRLEPLGPQHNEADHAAWMSSIEHIRATPGCTGWPPENGMTLEENLADLEEHADEFAKRIGFTYTVLDPSSGDVIGCLYLYPARTEDGEAEDGVVKARSWVRADRAELDVPLYAAVSEWLATAWPFKAVRYAPR